MSYIMTVQGAIPGNLLGFCHSHEHLFISGGQSAKINPALKIDSLEKTVAELKSFKDNGGNSIVDAQPLGCGRMPGNLLKASIAGGVHIIAVTGFHKLIFYPPAHWIHSITETDFALLLESEFEKGMFIDGDTAFPSRRINARPGAIKTATDFEGVTGEYRRLLTAAAAAARETGAPILSHTEMGRGALEQIKLFTDCGVPVESIIICHLDRRLEDFDYQLKVAETGVFLEFDTIGRPKYHSDEDEVEFIKRMVAHGFEDRILLGLDTTSERLKSYGGTPGLDYLATGFIPMLKEAGLPDRVIRKFMIKNPARAFGNKKLEIERRR